jgi:predicted enzyme related to lactoylglutathione lyase
MATATATTATGIDAVYYMTQDIQRARTFYETLLGLKPAVEMNGDGGGTFVEYELADGATFGLGHLPDAPFHESGGVMFAVPDVQAALDRAKELGARVVFDYMELPVCHMAWLVDTEGNGFCLHHRK